MPRTPVLERTTSIRALGAGFIALLLFFVWLTFAFFNKQFVSSEPITISTSRAGVNLPQNADVKLLGVIVGEVRTIEPDGDGVKMTLAMKPELLGDVPAGVTAKIVPKTLFGEKYISLIPPENLTGESLKAGTTISRAEVPIEVEKLLNDLYPLLTAVDPVNLSYTLNAVADALDGRGEQLGDTLVTTNSYLKKANPDVPQLVDDLVKFGVVSDNYAAAMPDLGRLLRNSVTTGNTLVAKRAQLAAFFDESTALSNTLTKFTEANGDNLVELAADSRPVLQVLADHSPTFPCFLAGMRQIIPRLDSAFRDGMLHINARFIPVPTEYEKNENVVVSRKAINGASTGAPAKNGMDINEKNAAVPSCLDLNEIVPAEKREPGSNKFSSQKNPFWLPAPVYELVNVRSSHNKFPPDTGSNRVAPGQSSMQSMVQPSMTGLDSPYQRAALNTLIGARAGMSADQVPDVASLIIGPLLRGSVVSVE
ncbi:MAG: MCE family protein [Aeromicrobium sp.]|uniref:MCE family protein n=1 Tax=Aeromicrobium sp. TaxID=1871063 RepID=UPI003C384A1A